MTSARFRSASVSVLPPHGSYKISGNRAKRSAAGQVRIIGGRARGRKLPVVNAAGLRPTSDRVRETLFNWLQTTVRGSRCLDLFAGSGALGFEAASRGAEHVLLVEKSQRVYQQLQRSAALLDFSAVSLLNGDWMQAAPPPLAPFDIVFIDPPFAGQLHDQAVQVLIRHQLLKPEALVYLEFDAGQRPAVPLLEPLKHRIAANVGYALYRLAG